MACAAEIFPEKFARNPGGDAKRKIKARGHHSHDRINTPVHRQVELREVSNAPKIALPITVADDHCLRAVLALLFRDEGAAEKRFNTERLEEATGDRGDVDTRGLAPARNGCGLTIGIFREARKRIVLFKKIFEIEVRQVPPLAVGTLLPHTDDLFGVRIRQRTKKHGVYNREDGC